MTEVPNDVGAVEAPPEFSDYSAAELADGLRSVFFVDGKAYIEKASAKVLAEKALALDEGIEELGEGSSSDVLELPEGRSPSYIFGKPGEVSGKESDDGRVLRGNTKPWNRIVHLSSGCSGTYIGPRTVLTAAHCVTHDAGAKKGQLHSVVVSPYAQGASRPNGSFTVPASSIRVTKKWVELVTDASDGTYNDEMQLWDFAVIRMDSDSPTGWMGWRSGRTGSMKMTIAGYPGGSGCPGTAEYPRLCSMSGDVYSRGSLWQTASIDMTGGQSGGPWFDSENYIHGINIAEWYYFDLWECGAVNCHRNRARRLDSVVMDEVKKWSDDL